MTTRDATPDSGLPQPAPSRDCCARTAKALVVVAAVVALLIVPVRVRAAVSLGGWMAHSPDDISGFTTLSRQRRDRERRRCRSRSRSRATSYTTLVDLDERLDRVRRQHRRATATRPTTACRRATHTNPFLAAYWDDLQTRSAPHVRYGTVGTSPNRMFIVDYEVDVDPANEGRRRRHALPGAAPRGLEHDHRALPRLGRRGRTARARRSASRAPAARRRRPSQPLTCNGKVLDDNRPTKAGRSTSAAPAWSTLAAIIGAQPRRHQRLHDAHRQRHHGDVDAAVQRDDRGHELHTVAISTNGWIEFGGNTAGQQRSDQRLPADVDAHQPAPRRVLGRPADPIGTQHPLRHRRHEPEPHLHRRLRGGPSSRSGEGSDDLRFRCRSTSARA